MLPLYLICFRWCQVQRGLLCRCFDIYIFSLFLFSVAAFDGFTVSNMHESMSNALCFEAQAQIAALSNGWCHKWLVNTLSCVSLRVDTDLFFALVRLLHGHKLSLLYATGAMSAGCRNDSSVPPECWQMSPPAFLPLAIKTSCFVSHPERSLPDLIVLFFGITRASSQTLISKCNPELNLKPLGQGVGGRHSQKWTGKKDENSAELFMKMLQMLIQMVNWSF